jgi:hypothetical protein
MAVLSGGGDASRVVDYDPFVVFTRPANTTAYTALDVLGIADAGTAANAGSAIHRFRNAGPWGGSVLPIAAELMIANASIPANMAGFRLHLYSSSPTAILDNAAFDLVSGDRSAYQGWLEFPTPLDLGSTLFSQAVYIGSKFSLASNDLFAQLQTLGGYTPASGTEYQIRLHLVRA